MLGSSSSQPQCWHTSKRPPRVMVVVAVVLPFRSGRRSTNPSVPTDVPIIVSSDDIYNIYIYIYIYTFIYNTEMNPDS